MHIDYGYQSPPVFDAAPLPSTAIVWNYLFKLFISLICSAIISGIIIDTFGEKREQ